MTHLESILTELNTLDTELKSTATRLWKIKFTLLSAFQQGHQQVDFYPRRLELLKVEKEDYFQTLLYRLQRLVALRLDRTLFIFSSREDVVALSRINRKIKSLHNAFTRELGIGPTWVRLNSVLPVPVRKAK